MGNIIVTGGAGFIGSNLVKKLLDRGYRVACVDNFSSDLYDPLFKDEYIKDISSNSSFVLYKGDICDKNFLKEVFDKEKPVAVAHLAAIANTRKAVSEPESYMNVNILGTLNILELARSMNLGNLVIASSSSVYGNDENIPWSEDSMADRPLSPYGMSKRADELLAYTYHHNFGLNITMLRYFNAYGENNRPDLVPYIWGEAILNDKEIEISGDGSRKRDYTYIGDIVDGTIRALEKPLGFEIINLGNSSPVSLKELLVVFEKVTGKKALVKSRPSNKASVESTYANIGKAKKLLDWEPTTSIEEGISKLITWLKSRRK